MSPHLMINHASSSSETSSSLSRSSASPPPSSHHIHPVQVTPIKGSNLKSMEVIRAACNNKLTKTNIPKMDSKEKTSNEKVNGHVLVIPKQDNTCDSRSSDGTDNIEAQTNTGNNLSQSVRYCKLYELQLNRYRAKRLRFFINGDKFFTGMNYALNTEKIRSFDALLNDLTRLLADQISLSKGVRFIFDSQGQLVNALEAFDGGSTYLCSSIESFVPMEYNIAHEKMNWLIRNSACITSAPKSRALKASLALNLEIPDTASANGGARSPVSRPKNSANINNRTPVVGATPNGVCVLTPKIQTPNTRTSINQMSATPKTRTPYRTNLSIAKATPNKTSSQGTANGGILSNKTNQRKETKSSTTTPASKTPNANHKSTIPTQNNDKKLDDIVEQKSSQQQSNDSANNKAKVMMTTSHLIFPKELTLRYDVGRPIGDGHFSIVYCCMNKSNQQFCALKLIDKLKCRGKEDMIYSEVNILKKLKHANIVTLIEEFDYPKQLYLILELVQDGDLFDAISTVTKFSEPDVATMIYNLSSALTYLHSQGIVHRDIKPENLLISVQEDGSQSVKLADFGLAVEVTGPLYTVCGT